MPGIKLFAADDIRKWDTYTLEHEPISSLNLMERAAVCVWNHLKQNIPKSQPLYIFCGLGNNGGDGLVIARKAMQAGWKVQTFLVAFGNKMSAECEANYLKIEGKVNWIRRAEELPVIPPNALLVDAIWGSGLQRPPQGLGAATIEAMNSSGCPVFSIDVPSGLFADTSSLHPYIVKATQTLTFQLPKLSFFFPEHGAYLGKIQVLDIGLSATYVSQQPSPFYLLDRQSFGELRQLRPRFAHKGIFGHLCLMAGSRGKMGAALLAAQAAMRSGLGLLSCYVPHSGLPILQSGFPEAMCIASDAADNLRVFEHSLSPFTAIAIGPGMGQSEECLNLLRQVFSEIQPHQRLILDADALNLLAANAETLLPILPKNTVLTPHLKEFDRLLGSSKSTSERWTKARTFSQKYQVYLLLKGAYTAIFTPEGEVYLNPTGNPGMATAGSGDVLCGILAALCAQSIYPLKSAVLLGVYVHGLAGDFALKKTGSEGLIASDIVKGLKRVWRE